VSSALDISRQLWDALRDGLDLSRTDPWSLRWVALAGLAVVAAGDVGLIFRAAA
jgi:hypothetical protein